MNKFKLKNRSIGENQPLFLIAEAGVNHNGDLSLAHKLIDKAADIGADAVKFQTFIAEEIVAHEAPLAGHHLANVGEELSHFDLIQKCTRAENDLAIGKNLTLDYTSWNFRRNEQSILQLFFGRLS